MELIKEKAIMMLTVPIKECPNLAALREIAVAERSKLLEG